MTPSQTVPLGESLYPIGQTHRAPQSSSTHMWLQPPLFTEHTWPAEGEKHFSITDIRIPEVLAASYQTIAMVSDTNLHHCDPSQTYRRLWARRCHLNSESAHHTAFQKIDTSPRDNLCCPCHTHLWGDNQEPFSQKWNLTYHNKVVHFIKWAPISKLWP